MKEFTLPCDPPKMKINSHVFVQEMSDIEIAIAVRNIQKAFTPESYAAMTEDQRYEKLEELSGFVDKVLGDGATKILSCGHAVNSGRLMLWLRKIGEAAADSVAESVDND